MRLDMAEVALQQRGHTLEKASRDLLGLRVRLKPSAADGRNQTCAGHMRGVGKQGRWLIEAAAQAIDRRL